MRLLITSLGVEVEDLAPNTWRSWPQACGPAELDPDLCRRIRASILLAGPVTARCGSLRLPTPGGDVIGRRRLDTHILALQHLGAQVSYDRMFEFRSKGLTGADILLDEASVTATENIVMAAVTAHGETIIRNAASEPHVQDVCNMLNTLGARIQDVGSNTLHITGVPVAARRRVHDRLGLSRGGQLRGRGRHHRRRGAHPECGRWASGNDLAGVPAAGCGLAGGRR